MEKAGAPPALLTDPSTTEPARGEVEVIARHCRYSGPSMWPTLREGDILEIQHKAEIRPGDIIFFRCGDTQVIHRAMAVTRQGIRTRGDHNHWTDQHLVQPGDAIGRVVAAHRGTKRRALLGGRLGLLWALALRAARVLSGATGCTRTRVVALVRSSIRLCDRGAPERLRFIRFGEVWRVLADERVVGHFDPERGRWILRWPYSWGLDPEDLDAAYRQARRSTQ